MTYISLIVMLIIQASAIITMPLNNCGQPKEDDCTKCELTRNPNRYLPDNCTCGFYQCIPDQFGGFIVKSMPCSHCTCWDQEKLTCIRNTNAECFIQPIEEQKTINGNTCTTTGPGYAVTFGLIPSDLQSYYMYVTGGKIKMPCPPGTQFSLGDCLCSRFSQIRDPDPFMCLTFDRNDSFTSENGVYINSQDVAISNNGRVGKAAYFNGASSNIEVPAFSNKESPVLSLSLWYKRDLTSDSDIEALISNDDCTTGLNPSIQVLSTNYSKVLGGFRAGVDTNHISNSQRFTDNGPDNWNHVAVVYDGSKITFYLDGAARSTRQASGMIKSVQCPLLIGSMYKGGHFKGYMDQICFYNYALVPEQVKNLYDTPSEVMHPSSDP